MHQPPKHNVTNAIKPFSRRLFISLARLASQPMWRRAGAMLEEPLRRVAVEPRSPRKNRAHRHWLRAVHLLPPRHDGKGDTGHGATAGKGEGYRGLAGLSCNEGSSGPISRAWSGRAPDQPAAAAGAAVNTCRLATTRTQAALPAERES
ncbi:hypothetical protein GOODEAATRI_019573 [Goodea atripinnis]|uniref:Uncharacterized protein n=1 Tax=Goodea atripinnis TaxID=208336 RepID=A0ABV0PQ04_9TELE